MGFVVSVLKLLCSDPVGCAVKFGGGVAVLLFMIFVSWHAVSFVRALFKRG
jgi:hypothetical protein